MNIAFLLTPKSEVIYLQLDCTMRQAMERMEYHRYSAVPLVDKQGRYAGTITEGDLLWKLKNTPGLSFEGTEDVMLKEVAKQMKNEPVLIETKVKDLLSLAMVQNFVPVVDDSGTFIGIVRRREIIEYCMQMLKK